MAIRPSAQAEWPLTSGLGSESDLERTGTASGDPQFPSATANATAQPVPIAEGFTPSPVYRRRRPQATRLYEAVQHHLETFLAMADEGELDRLPPWVEPEFRRYLTRGILAFGFARIRCQDCRQERLLAFSCKGRCVCPSCTNRRMAEVAAHPSHCVIPAVPVRQWVLSVPKRLRPQLARDPTLCSAVLRILFRAIRAELVSASGRITAGDYQKANDK